MWRLMPETFVPGSIALERCRVRVRVRVLILHALRIHDQQRRLCAAPQFQTGRANLDFFKARSKGADTVLVGLAAPLAKYECTVRHLGKIAGQKPPLAARAQQVQHGAEHLMQVHRPGLGTSAHAAAAGGGSLQTSRG